MHMLGRQAQVSIERGSDDDSCLLWIDDWDFHWQSSYSLRDAAVLGPNDELQLACEWDNSAENQAIVDGEPREPVDTNWGDGTFDEMCTYCVFGVAKMPPCDVCRFGTCRICFVRKSARSAMPMRPCARSLM